MLTLSLLEQIDTCNNDLEKLSTTKVNKHTTCNYALLVYYSFNTSKNKHDYDRSKYCMKNF